MSANGPTVEPLRADDETAHRAVIALLEGAFGPGPMTVEKLVGLCLDPKNAALVARDAAGEVLAFALAGPLADDRRGAYAGFGDEADAFVRDAGNTFGAVRILVVRPDARRAGLGRALGARMMSALRDLGCTHAIGVCWDHGGPDTSRPLFELGGFLERGASRDFYRERQRVGEHQCRYCGTPCGCLARLYARDLAP